MNGGTVGQSVRRLHFSNTVKAIKNISATPNSGFTLTIGQNRTGYSTGATNPASVTMKAQSLKTASFAPAVENDSFNAPTYTVGEGSSIRPYRDAQWKLVRQSSVIFYQ